MEKKKELLEALIEGTNKNIEDVFNFSVQWQEENATIMLGIRVPKECYELAKDVVKDFEGVEFYEPSHIGPRGEPSYETAYYFMNDITPRREAFRKVMSTLIKARETLYSALNKE